MLVARYEISFRLIMETNIRYGASVIIYVEVKLNSTHKNIYLSNQKMRNDPKSNLIKGKFKTTFVVIFSFCFFIFRSCPFRTWIVTWHVEGLTSNISPVFFCFFLMKFSLFAEKHLSSFLWVFCVLPRLHFFVFLKVVEVYLFLSCLGTGFWFFLLKCSLFLSPSLIRCVSVALSPWLIRND